MKWVGKALHNSYVQWTIIGVVVLVFLCLGIRAIVIEDMQVNK